MQPPQHDPHDPNSPWWARTTDVMSEVRPDWRDHVPPWQPTMLRQEVEAHIRNLASERLGHAFAGVATLQNMRPTYEVAGLRDDGTLDGKHRLARAAVVILRPVRNLILSVFGMTIGFLMGDPTLVTSARHHRVRGHQGCQALAFLAPVTPGPWTIGVEPLWLVWSAQQAALFTLPDNDPEKLALVWAGTTQRTAPRVDVAARTLTWSDGSSITLEDKHVSSTAFDHPHPAGGQQ